MILFQIHFRYTFYESVGYQNEKNKGRERDEAQEKDIQKIIPLYWFIQ